MRKRVVLPTGLVLLVGAAAVGVFVRGTWADGIVKTPSTHADGLVRQLVATPDGRKVVRGALVVDAPVEQVWSVITDYDHFADFMPNIASVTTSVEPDGRIKLAEVASTFAGDFPVELHVKHDKAAWTTSWDEPSGPFRTNRGRWVLEPRGASTLAVYEIDLELKGYPTAVVRTLLLHRLKKLFAAVDARAVSPRRPS